SAVSGCRRRLHVSRCGARKRASRSLAAIVGQARIDPNLVKPSRNCTDVLYTPLPIPAVVFSKYIGIDLGTANVLVYVKGRSIVLNEPSVVAYSASANKLVAVGSTARNY